MSRRVTVDNMPIVMAVASAVLYLVILELLGDTSWRDVLWFAPVVGVGSYIGYRLGLWWFGSRRG